MELEGRGREVNQIAFSFLLSETAGLWNLVGSALSVQEIPLLQNIVLHLSRSITPYYNYGEDGCPSAPQGEHRVLDSTTVSRETVHLCCSREQGWEDETYEQGSGKEAYVRLWQHSGGISLQVHD